MQTESSSNDKENTNMEGSLSSNVSSLLSTMEANKSADTTKDPSIPSVAETTDGPKEEANDDDAAAGDAGHSSATAVVVTAEEPLVDESKKDDVNVSSPKDEDHHDDDAKDKERTDNKQDDSKVAATTKETFMAAEMRPIKRARTAYFIFCEAKRPEVQKQHVGESVAVVAKALGQLWAALTDEEKQVFQQKAAEERAQVQAELKAREAAGLLPDVPSSNSKQAYNPYAMPFPLGRMRKIVKLDPEINNINKDALVHITKATELFLVKLGLETVSVANVQNRRKLLPEDVAMVCQTRDVFGFLRDDVKDLVAEQQQQDQGTATAAGTKRKAEAATQGNKLTSYFVVKSKDS